jgi:S1-C subfamily serine protease
VENPSPARQRAADAPSPSSRPPRKSSSALALLAAALTGAILSVACGVLYPQHFGPSSVGTTVSPAPVIRSSRSAAINPAAIYKSDAPGVVLVQSQITGTAAGPFGPQPHRGTAQGSGFMIDGQGSILTNYHVVAGASKTTVTLKDGKVYDAQLAGSDPSTDVAVLRIDAPTSELKPLPLGDSSKLQVGQPVVAIGNPLGYSETETQGIVSALHRDIQAPNGFAIPGAIQTDAPLTNGSSGGPLIDSNGRVVGIASQVAASQDGSSQADGIGFAVPINTAKDVVKQLAQSGRVVHPYLGISGYGITPDIASLFPTDKGVVVAKVAPGSPAQKAGIRGGNRIANAEGGRFATGGDVIEAVDGKPVSDMSRLQALVSNDKVGQRVTLKILRGSQTMTVQVTLGNRPHNIAY